MSKLLERLTADFQGLFNQYDAILDRCAVEMRDPDDAEETVLMDLRSELDPMSERIKQLRADEERRMSTILSGTTSLPIDAGSSLVHVTHEPELYRKDNQSDTVFFRDRCMPPSTTTPRPAPASTGTRS